MRKHLNLFVTEGPVGVICASMMLDYAEDKYHGVTVKYVKDGQWTYETYSFIESLALARTMNADPCGRLRHVMLVPPLNQKFMTNMEPIKYQQEEIGFQLTALYKGCVEWKSRINTAEGLCRWLWRRLRPPNKCISSLIRNYYTDDGQYFVDTSRVIGEQEAQIALTSYSHTHDFFDGREFMEYYWEEISGRNKDEKEDS